MNENPSCVECIYYPDKSPCQDCEGYSNFLKVMNYDKKFKRRPLKKMINEAEARYYDEKYLDKLIQEEELKKKCDDAIRVTFFDAILDKLTSDHEFKDFMENYFGKNMLEIAERTYNRTE